MKDIWRPNEGYRISTDGQLLFAGFVREGVRSSSVTVGATATALPATAYSNRHTLLIQNYGSVEVFIGGSDVSTVNGISLLPRATLQIGITDDAKIYGIVSVGTADVRILEGA